MSQAQLHRSRRRLIIGGQDIAPKRFPYFTSIDKNNGVILNGALIAPDVVLSAGHILTNSMEHPTIKIGTYNVHATNATLAGEEIKMKGFIMHSNWSQFAPEFFANDFCLIKLAEPSAATPVRINKDPLVPTTGAMVRMLGLGWTNESYLSPSSIVQQVDLVTITNTACENITDPQRGMSYEGLIVPSMLCTVAPPNTTRDGCAWDSGAPVIMTHGNDPSNDVLVGLGSTGVECADPVFPSIQARVSDGYDWIEREVCKLSADPPQHFNCSKYSSKIVAGAVNNATKKNSLPIKNTNNNTQGLAFEESLPVNGINTETSFPFSPLNTTASIVNEKSALSRTGGYMVRGAHRNWIPASQPAFAMLAVLALVLVTFKKVLRLSRAHSSHANRLVNDCERLAAYGAIRE